MLLLNRFDFRYDMCREIEKDDQDPVLKDRKRRPTLQSWYMFSWNWINNAAHLIGVILMDLSNVEMFNFIFSSICFPCPNPKHWLAYFVIVSRLGIMPPSAHHLNNQIPSQPRFSVGFRNRIILPFFLSIFLYSNHFMVISSGIKFKSECIFSLSLSTALFRSNWVSHWNGLMLWPNCI